MFTKKILDEHEKKITELYVMLENLKKRFEKHKGNYYHHNTDSITLID